MKRFLNIFFWLSFAATIVVGYFLSTYNVENIAQEPLVTYDTIYAAKGHVTNISITNDSTYEVSILGTTLEIKGPYDGQATMFSFYIDSAYLADFQRYEADIETVEVHVNSDTWNLIEYSKYD